MSRASFVRATHNACQLCECGRPLGAHSDSPPHPCLDDDSACTRFRPTPYGVCDCHQKPEREEQ